MLRWLWLSTLLVALDQATKWLALERLAPYEAVPLVPGFNLTLMFNTGAAFSFLSNAGGWQRWGLSLLALVLSVALTLWLRRLTRAEVLSAAGLALVIGGAIGNLWDRLVYGYVVDFIDIYVADWHWPAFNIADSAITVGAALLVWEGLFGGRRTADEKTNGQD
ncbi:MAG: signal peptidase II [Gammaproteobacteria bacterium]|nr:signal peptidase II [Gammaproteobacteria bacterium]